LKIAGCVLKFTQQTRLRQEFKPFSHGLQLLLHGLRMLWIWHGKIVTAWLCQVHVSGAGRITLHDGEKIGEPIPPLTIREVVA